MAPAQASSDPQTNKRMNSRDNMTGASIQLQTAEAGASAKAAGVGAAFECEFLNVTFRVRDVQLQPDERLVLLGEGDVLGDFETSRGCDMRLVDALHGLYEAGPLRMPLPAASTRPADGAALAAGARSLRYTYARMPFAPAPGKLLDPAYDPAGPRRAVLPDGGVSVTLEDAWAGAGPRVQTVGRARAAPEPNPAKRELPAPASDEEASGSGSDGDRATFYTRPFGIEDGASHYHRSARCGLTARRRRDAAFIEKHRLLPCPRCCLQGPAPFGLDAPAPAPAARPIRAGLGVGGRPSPLPAAPTSIPVA
eukprot:tig00020964_g16793.t1